MTIERNKAIEAGEAELEQVLRNFRQSAQAWSDAEYSRPRAVAASAVHRTLRRVVAWALGCVLAAGSLTGWVLEVRHRQEIARTAAERESHLRQGARLQSTVAATPAEQPAQTRAGIADDELLATVDKDVSRVAPSAMEPLAQLMDDSSGQ